MRSTAENGFKRCSKSVGAEEIPYFRVNIMFTEFTYLMVSPCFTPLRFCFEEDVAGRDRFFEVVGKPLGAAYGGMASPVASPAVAQESTLQRALSFRVVGECPATSRHMEASQRRCFKAASNGRWALLAHILSEFPQLATAKDDAGVGSLLSALFYEHECMSACCCGGGWWWLVVAGGGWWWSKAKSLDSAMQA